MTDLGFTYRLTDFGCALGLSQLSRLDAALARRRAIALRYLQAFAAHSELVLPAVRPESESAWHLFPVRLVLERLSADRAEIIRALHAEGIGVNVHYLPIYRHPYYVERFGDQTETCPVAEAAYERLVSLPLFAGMTDQDVDDVIRAVTKVLTAYAR